MYPSSRFFLPLNKYRWRKQRQHPGRLECLVEKNQRPLFEIVNASLPEALILGSADSGDGVRLGTRLNSHMLELSQKVGDVAKDV